MRNSARTRRSGGARFQADGTHPVPANVSVEVFVLSPPCRTHPIPASPFAIQENSSFFKSYTINNLFDYKKTQDVKSFSINTFFEMPSFSFNEPRTGGGVRHFNH